MTRSLFASLIGGIAGLSMFAAGKLYEKGKTTLLGAPSPAMTAELEKLWKKEFRQQ